MAEGGRFPYKEKAALSFLYESRNSMRTSREEAGAITVPRLVIAFKQITGRRRESGGQVSSGGRRGKSDRGGPLSRGIIRFFMDGEGGGQDRLYVIKKKGDQAGAIHLQGERQGWTAHR